MSRASVRGSIRGSFMGLERGSPMTLSFDDHNSLDDLSDQALVDLVMDMDMECKRIKLENKMFLDFLRDNDAAGLEGVDNLMKYLNKTQEKRAGLASAGTQSMMSLSSRRSVRLDSVTSISSIVEGRGPKINLTQKADMVGRAIEDTQTNLEDYTQKTHKIKQKLSAELEEFGLRECDIKEAREIFEFSVVIQGLDPLTQRIPAEKFIRYMEEWLKSAQLSIQKLRLRTTSIIQLYKKVSVKLVQRKELGENIRPVDFAQLKIENQYHRDQIDDKSIYLVDLKKMNGGASLVLTNFKKYSQKQEQDYNNLKDMIEEKKKLIIDTEEEGNQKKEELDKAWEIYERVRLLKETYKVPDVIEYVKIKNDLYDLNKSIKVWERRKKIQDITLNACVRQMKNITGRSKVDPAWLEEVADEIQPLDDDTF